MEKSKKTNSEEVRLSAVVWSECSTALDRVISFYSICSTEQLIGKRSFVVGTVEMSWAQLN